ncbi:hypothetical protein LFX25_03625 [Leptospira sp. FAT2]|uniref:hypothetical protein n=1 Tax=Leptospira sanjuanensis TaxID=2879643 RepID=UPI001EE8358F|nr:hypothetical protein [Leptospira sanjuanensis]MCG6192328.1 hypothetical protein [Leptospira sanjuanensis]
MKQDMEEFQYRPVELEEREFQKRLNDLVCDSVEQSLMYILERTEEDEFIWDDLGFE